MYSNEEIKWTHNKQNSSMMEIKRQGLNGGPAVFYPILKELASVFLKVFH